MIIGERLVSRFKRITENGVISKAVERQELARPIPNHVAIMMDGNRRWAQREGIARIDGHRIGLNENLEPIVIHASKRGIKELTVWGLSPENLNRGEAQLNELFTVFRESFTDDMVDRFVEEGVRVRPIGRLYQLPQDIQRKIEGVENRTKDGEKITVNFGIVYGGQEEIIDAVNRLPRIRLRRVSQERLSKRMYAPNMSPVDLIIRPGGEQRLSGFMLWEGPYAELIFSDKLWPEFGSEDLDAALDEYARRDRRFGGNSPAIESLSPQV